MTEIEYLKKQNKDLIDKAVTNLIGGAAKDYAEYRELVGLIRGLDRANSHLEDLEEKVKKDNDE
jgi:hypothetical protein